MNLIFKQPLQLHTIAVAIIFFWVFTLSANACDVTTTTKDAANEDINEFFESEDKYVVTFVGYSGSEYEDNVAMLEVAGSILDEFDSTSTIVNIGATPEGIGAVYAIAKEKGFYTTGIVSTQAKAYDAQLSPCVDTVFYVEDASWGGFIDGSTLLSPTSTAMVENSDLLIGIGGGSVGRDELIAAREMGKEVRFIPADMNHRKAREKALKKGLPEPTNFGGAAGEL